MKAQIRTFLLSILPVASIFILQNCGRDDEPSCPSGSNSYFLGESVNYVPYSGNDTIVMVSNTADTIKCIGQGKQSLTTSDFEPNSNPDCSINTGVTNTYEAYKIVFMDTNKNIQINLAHYKKAFFQYGYLKGNQTYMWNIVEVIFKDKKFYINDFHISNSNLNQYYKGHMNFNGSEFPKVTQVNKDYFQDSTSKMFINQTDGILRFELNNIEFWTILN